MTQKTCSMLQGSRFSQSLSMLGWGFGDAAVSESLALLCLLTQTHVHTSDQTHWSAKLDFGVILTLDLSSVSYLR